MNGGISSNGPFLVRTVAFRPHIRDTFVAEAIAVQATIEEALAALRSRDSS
jgi:hypothetical protein